MHFIRVVIRVRPQQCPRLLVLCASLIRNTASTSEHSEDDAPCRTYAPIVPEMTSRLYVEVVPRS